MSTETTAANCRCGQRLEIPPGAERVVCPSCGAKIRLRRVPTSSDGEGGHIRFRCPCGRRLKMSLSMAGQQGRCPDCQRVLHVPTCTPETDTEELRAVDRQRLDRWGARHRAEAAPAAATPRPNPPARDGGDWSESGLRICPSCGKPVHVAATQCRLCGAEVPRR